MPALYLSCLFNLLHILFYYFGIIQSIQSFCIYSEISNIQKGHFLCLWLRGREILVYIKLGLEKNRLRILLILDLKMEEPQTLVPLQTISLLSSSTVEFLNRFF